MRIRVMFVVSIAAAALCATLAAQAPTLPAGQTNPAAGQGGRAGRGAQNPNGMHIYIRAGLKSHGEGQHDYPQLLADWSKILTERGAVVDGSLHSPSPRELAGIDVVVMYKGDAGYMTDEEKADLEAFVKRGGGIVTFHDSLCGPDPEYFANTLTGGAKKHGETNFSQGMLHYTIVDKTNPIMEGMSDFDMQEEAFMLMTWAKVPIHPLATVAMPGGAHQGEVVPQIWTYEHTLPGGQPSRAFVWMQGHIYKNFADPRIQPMILRGIAWAAKKPIDSLMTVVQPPRGGRGPGGSDIVVPNPPAPGTPTPAAPGTTGRGRGRGFFRRL